MRLTAWRAVLALCLSALGACHSIDPYLDACRQADPRHFVLLLPEGRQHWAAVRALVARKQASGLSVTVIQFAPTGTLQARVASLRPRLAAARPPKGQRAYLLVLATAEELPMGPWSVEGVSQPVLSDVPYLLPDAGSPLTEAEWRVAFESDFPWIIGRLPFGDEPALARVLESGSRYARSAGHPLAMIGGERFAVWWDTSLIMSSARSRLADRGWRTITYAEDWPCDIELGVKGDDAMQAAHAMALARATPPAAAGPKPVAQIPITVLDAAPDAEALLFLTHWIYLTPEVVYLNSHGSPWSVGNYLISDDSLAAFRAHSATRALPTVPPRPALLINIACSGGVPNSPLMHELFAGGWVCGVIGSTEATAPTPLFAAIRSEVHVGRAIGAGLSIGLMMRAAQESYFADAQSSWSYWMFSSTVADTANNLLGMTLYGDPSIRMPRCEDVRRP